MCYKHTKTSASTITGSLTIHVIFSSTLTKLTRTVYSEGLLTSMPPSHIHIFNRRQMTVIKLSPTFRASSLNHIVLPFPIFSNLPCICLCHRNFGCIQNFRLVIEKSLLTAWHQGKADLWCMLPRSRSSLSANFSLENVHCRYRRKHKVESRFIKETADLDANPLGLNDSAVGGGRWLYSPRNWGTIPPSIFHPILEEIWLQIAALHYRRDEKGALLPCYHLSLGANYSQANLK